MTVRSTNPTHAVTLVFSLGNFQEVLQSPIGQPYLAIILNATHSRAGTMVLAVTILILVTSCAVNGLTTISRQIW
jgi:choline transport protein